MIKCSLNVEEDTHTILMTFTFESRFELMPDPLSKVVRYHSSSVTLHQEPASPKRLRIHQAGPSYGSQVSNFFLSYRMRKLEMRPSEGKKMHELPKTQPRR